MKLRHLSFVLIPLAIAATILLQSPSSPAVASFSPPQRTFRFTYSFVVKDIPKDSKIIRVWVPVAQSDAHQTVHLVNVKSPVPTHKNRDTEYGNEMIYAELRAPADPSATFTLEYEVTRLEYTRGGFAQLEPQDAKPAALPASFNRLLAPDALIPLDGKIKTLAYDVTGNAPGSVAKARAAYEYLFTNFRYDKTGTGWGRGDALWACDAKHGNCTDFHSPFIGMLRADGIPARFDIGFPIPTGKDSGDIPGYHCWAEFYAGKIGWVPVDISEAWKAKEKHEYFFGSVDANRVQFSTGRDVTLSPKQAGVPLNYFVYPYVEVDGKTYDGVTTAFSFAESKSNASAKGPVNY
jgi:transglutaminase-like putative cysteine protease